MDHPSDTYSLAGHERRRQLEPRLQRAVGRRWLNRQGLAGYDLTIAARGTLDGLASVQVSVIREGRARLSWHGRIALYEARHRAHGLRVATLGRCTHGTSKLPKPLHALYTNLDRAVDQWRAAA